MRCAFINLEMGRSSNHARCPSLPQPEGPPQHFDDVVRQTLHVQFPNERLSERSSETYVEIGYLHCYVLFCIVACKLQFVLFSNSDLQCWRCCIEIEETVEYNFVPNISRSPFWKQMDLVN
jgi:hypothetical protein